MSAQKGVRRRLCNPCKGWQWLKWNEMVEATLALFCPLSLFLPLGPCLLLLWLSFILFTHAQRPLLCRCYTFYTRMLACLTTQARLWDTAPAAAANPASAGRKSPDARAAPFHGPWRHVHERQRRRARGSKGNTKAKHRTRLPDGTLYLKGVEEQLTVHPDLPAEPPEGVGQAHEHNVMHSKDQHQDQGWFGQFPWRRMPAFLVEDLDCLSVETACWKKMSLTELSGADFSPSLWISQVLSPSSLLPRLCWTESFLLTSHDYYPLSLSNLFPFLHKGHHLYKAVKCLFFCPKF